MQNLARTEACSGSRFLKRVTGISSSSHALRGSSFEMIAITMDNTVHPSVEIKFQGEKPDKDTLDKSIEVSSRGQYFKESEERRK